MNETVKENIGPKNFTGEFYHVCIQEVEAYNPNLLKLLVKGEEAILQSEFYETIGIWVPKLYKGRMENIFFQISLIYEYRWKTKLNIPDIIQLFFF